MKRKAITTMVIAILLLLGTLGTAFNATAVRADTTTKTIKVETAGGALTGSLASTFTSDIEIKFEVEITEDDGVIGGEAELTVKGKDASEEDVKFEAKWDVDTELSGGQIWLYYGGARTDGVEFKVGDAETVYSVTSGRFGSWEKSPGMLNIVVVSDGTELLRVTGSTITELKYILPLKSGWGAAGPGSGEVVVELKDSSFEVLVMVFSAYSSTNYQVHFGYLTPVNPALDHFGPLTPWAHWGPPYPLVSWVELGDFTTDESGDGKLSLELEIQSEQLFTGIFAINLNPSLTVLHTGAYPNNKAEIATLGIDTILFAVP